MGLGVHIRVHPHGNWRLLFQPTSNLVDTDKLRFALSVERVNALLECEFDFLLCFSDAGKDAFCRVTASRYDALQFTAADEVKSASGVGEGSQYAEV